MKHLVIIPDGVTSKQLSAVEMARRLRDAGYQITFIGKGGDYNQIDEFDYFRLDVKLDLKKTYSTSSTKERVNPLHVLLDEISPDLLLIDVEMHPYVLAAIASKFPVALFSVFFNLMKHRSMPPLHYDIVPGRGVAGGAFMIELAWLRFRLSKFISNKRQKLKHRGKDKLSNLENYAAKLGLLLADHVDCYQWLIPFIYRDLPVLVLSPIEMEFQFLPDHKTTYVGPMICSDRTNLPFINEKSETNADIHKLLDLHRYGRNDRRLVYCSFGCFFGGDDSTFWKKLVEAFSNTEYDVIFAFGNRLKADFISSLPENIHCSEFAPQLDILPLADCAIIHSGLVTILECIHFGVPMVTYPFNINDQQGNAARITYHKIGVKGDRLKDSPVDIRNHVERAMDDQELIGNLAQMRKRIEINENTRKIVEGVERIITEAGERE